MKRERNKLVSILLFFLTGTGVFAGELRIETLDSELDKINFIVAMEAAKKSQSAVDRQVVVSSHNRLSSAYENGDVYYLNGNLTDEWTHREWDLFYEIAKWLVRSNFRVIMNPLAQEDDVREAIQNPNVTVVIWSSHGSPTGELFDTAGAVLPKDVFYKNASPHLHQLILSNCHGETTVQYYAFPNGVKIKHWIGESTTKDLFDYLFSDDWNNDLLTD